VGATTVLVLVLVATDVYGGPSRYGGVLTDPELEPDAAFVVVEVVFEYGGPGPTVELVIDGPLVLLVVSPPVKAGTVLAMLVPTGVAAPSVIVYVLPSLCSMPVHASSKQHTGSPWYSAHTRPGLQYPPLAQHILPSSGTHPEPQHAWPARHAPSPLGQHTSFAWM